MLRCEKCQNPVSLYQKDGPGILKRLYIDRLATPKTVRGKQLVCPGCKTVLGIRMIYKKENRPAYRLFAGAIIKKAV
jgi:hypothetical protein